MAARWIAMLGLLALPGAVSADELAVIDQGARAWHVGLNLRSDIGPHRLRVNGGVRLGRLDLSAVLDWKVFIDNKQNDTDVLAEWAFSPGGTAALLGWRASSEAIDRGRQWQESLLLGLTGGLPPLLRGRLRGRFGVEFDVTLVRHGVGLPTEWIAFSNARHYRDVTGFNLFLRFELGGPL